MSNTVANKKTEKKTITICLAGNPNSGKTTIFNALTGLNQKVGNYSGVTVEKKQGGFTYNDNKINVIDLPGTYSLSAYSMEEIIARDFIITEKPDLVVDIVDSTNLERSLYLAVQLKELGIPLIIALNMSDMAEKQNLKFDVNQLETLFGAKFVKTIGTKKSSLEDLKKAIVSFSNEKTKFNNVEITHGDYVEKSIDMLSAKIKDVVSLDKLYPVKWLALKVLEQDEKVLEILDDVSQTDKQSILNIYNQEKEKIAKEYNEEPETVIAEGRYAFINGLLKECTISTLETRKSITDKIDKIILNRVLGLPIFLLIMYGIFYVSVDLASPLIDYVDGLFGSLGEAVKAGMGEGILRDLITEGIIGGVGGVMVFVPQILILFLCISILEGTGYLARAAFVIDKLMHKVGLHGKSFIPMLIGFGCTVPAIMATRTLENENDRKTTMLASTFMSCGARLPVYVLITGALFSARVASSVIFAIYLIGIAVGILTAKLLKKFVYKSQAAPLVMELPPYRVPTLNNVIRHMGEKAWMYLKRAGTIILGVAIVFWFLTSFPKISEKQEAVFTNKITNVKNTYNDKFFSIYQKFDTSAETKTEKTDFSKAVEANQNYKSTFLKIDKVNKDFKNAVKKGKLSDNSAAYKTLAAKRDEKLHVIKQENPVYYNAVVEYLKLKSAKKETIAGINLEKVSFEKRNSFAGRIGNFIAPVFAPMGVDDWKIGISLIAGFAAKEVFVGTLGTVYAVGEEEDEESVSLRQRILKDPLFLSRKPISKDLVAKTGGKYHLINDKSKKVVLVNGKFYRPNLLVAFALMIFVLLYLPCMAVVGVYVKEAGWKSTWFMLAYTTVVAWGISTLVYQIGRLFT